MTTLQCSVDEKLADAARQKAAAAGKTVDAWLAEIVATNVLTASDSKWAQSLIDASTRLHGNSAGKKWSRSDLHDE